MQDTKIFVHDIGENKDKKVGKSLSGTPILIFALFAALVLIWRQLALVGQSNVLTAGWPVLGVTAVIQTFLMFRLLVRPHLGYRA